MKNKYTLILLPPDNQPARQFQLSLKGKKILIVCSILVLGALGGLITHDVYQYHYIQRHEAEYARIGELEKRLAIKDAQLQELHKQTQKIYQDLEKIAALENQIASILKLNARSSTPLSRSLEDARRLHNLNVSEDFAVELAQLTSEELVSHVTTLQFYYQEALKYQDRLNHTPSMLPVEGPIVSTFGYRRNPFGGWSREFHNGVDIAVNYGTPVKAPADGKVTFSGWDGAYGYKVEIDHGYGIVTFYGHNSRLLVKAGDSVKRGDIIAYSGNSGRSTGAHVHFGAYINGEPVDPLMFINPTKEQ